MKSQPNNFIYPSAADPADEVDGELDGQHGQEDQQEQHHRVKAVVDVDVRVDRIKTRAAVVIQAWWVVAVGQIQQGEAAV